MKVQCLDFSMFHNRRPVVGSTYIRMFQLMKYWPEFTRYRYGDWPDVLIFQKVYCNADYKFPKQFENLKILDICDPDHLNGNAVKETYDAVDGIVTSTERMAEFMRQLGDKPVQVIPDRFDLELIPKPKVHKGKAKTAVWFGYVHNAEALKFGMDSLNRLGIKLIVVSNEDPHAWKWTDESYKTQYTYKKYREETIYDEILKADFAFLPKNNRPEDEFKSNNRTIKANLVGLPVVFDKETLEKYTEASERQKWFDTEYDIIRRDYDVRLSVKEYKDFIDAIK